MKSYRIGVLVGVVLVCLLGVVVFSVFGLASADNSCTGHSCDSLPTKAQACLGPAADKNPHCNPNMQATATKTNFPSPTPTPTIRFVTTVTKNDSACENGICPDPACSLATIAAAQATQAYLQSTLVPYLMKP